MALVNIISFYTQDTTQIDRIFRKSSLIRPKWDDIHGSSTYGQTTIQKSLETRLVTISYESDGFDDEQRLLHRCSDVANAERLVKKHGSDIRYCHQDKSWYIWNGKVWKRDKDERIAILAIDTIREIYHEASEERSDHTRKTLSKHAQASESLVRRKAMVESARALKSIRSEDFDAIRTLMNLENGTIELDSFSFRECRRDDLLTKVAGISYDANSECPEWLEHLNLIFNSDEAYIQGFQMMCGYSLLQGNPEQVMFILWGTGKNGKSKTVDVLAHIMGDYAVNMAPESLMVRRNSDGARSDIARLNGARLITSSEGESNSKLAEALIKQLTGGDIVTVRRLYEEEFEYRPEGKIWYATNHKPEIRGTDEAIWRRVRLLPFIVTIPEEKRDTHILDKLLQEKAGIFNWMLTGLKRYYENGSRLDMPECVKLATQQYRNESDILGDFIRERCIMKDKEICSRLELYTTYRVWCEQNGDEPLGNVAFAKLLKERGIIDGKNSGSTRRWKGIRLKTQKELDADAAAGSSQEYL
jgi:putative DNA primase/helicase